MGDYVYVHTQKRKYSMMVQNFLHTILKSIFACDIDCFDNLISNYKMSRFYLKFKILMGLKHNV